MKKNILLLLTLITFFNAFSQSQPTFTMTKEGKGYTEFRIALKNPGTVSVDWGNDKKKSYKVGASAKISEATVISGKIAKDAVVKVYAEGLVFLYCREQALATLDLTNATEIKVVDCSMNSLTSFDVTNNRDLDFLNFHKNKVTAIDLTNNAKLKTLNCSFNNLESLDLAENKILNHLSLFENNINSLTLSSPNKITTILASRNKLSSINFTGSNSLSYLDISNNSMEGCELNRAFSELPINKKSSSAPNLKINNNLGASTSNTDAASDKRWVLDRTGKGTAVCN